MKEGLRILPLHAPERASNASPFDRLVNRVLQPYPISGASGEIIALEIGPADHQPQA